ncbi:SusC/RagA family TonB-linked outer membrane protein [Pseudopedobacter beijingensis]|uniref:SusC/RagA family TonB-linked outer membrane protein n=1 Tax=Pseudopedobacter beijingensis TaxID=1207056 RepID=A0ABW4IBJ3_9SPHI
MRKVSLFIFLILTYLNLSAQQTKLITGTVHDAELNDALIGVSVSVKGSTIGAVTDVNGKYSIKVPQNEKPVLVFRYLGYSPKEVATGELTTVNVKLSKENKSLNEVVVIGYGEVKRRDVTGSVASVKMEDLQKAPVGSAIEALAGRVAGVQVSSVGGKPGGGVNIIVRGANSITQDNSPLYVIDGFPMEDANSNVLNPSEIESIEVLKDASATAIYGARGANGVILITTKRGKEGAPQVNYSGYAGAQSVINKIELMDPYEFVKLNAERDPQDIKKTYLRGDTTLDYYKTVKGIDWQDELFRTAFMQDHSLSIYGGNKTTKYSFSGNLFDQKGVIINSGFGRKQGRVTLDQNFGKKLKTGVDVRYTSTKTYGANPASPEANHSAMNYLMYSVWGYRPITYGDNRDLIDDLVAPGTDENNDYRINPILSAKNEVRDNYNTRIIFNGYAEYAILPELKFKITGSANNSDWRNESFNNSKTRYGYPKSNNKVNGSILYTESDTWQNENLLTYNKSINKVHNINAVAGLVFQENNYKRYGVSAILLPNETLGLAGLGQGVAQPVTSIITSWSMMSYLGRVNYNYNNRYYLTASYRADGSSKFMKQNRWGYFPSAAASWRIIQEDFMKDIKFLSDAKIRLGYGVTGNNRVTEYAPYAALNFENTGPASNGYYAFGNALTPGVYLGSIANPDLKWESTAQSNVGIDLGAFKQRLIFTVDYYKKKTTDLLLNASLPYSTGYSTAYKNIGSTSNEGIELSVSGDVIKNKEFNWNASFNIAFNKNKVLSLTQNQESRTSTVNWDQFYRTIPAYIAKVGQPLGQIYGYIWDGVYQYDDFDKQADGSYKLKQGITNNGAAVQPGDIKYRDLNGDGTVNDLDRTVIGRGYPIHQGGFSNNFTYKGFDLNLFFQWSYGNDIINANRLWFEGGDKAYLNQYATFSDRWTPENQSNTMFRVRGQGSYAYSSRIVEDGSYLRLKTISLGYKFPVKYLKGMNIKNLRVYASAQNLLTFTKYSGYDPEVAVYYSALTPGFDYSSYPRPKTIVFGVNLSL